MEKRDETGVTPEAGERLIVVKAEPPNLEVPSHELATPITRNPFVRTNFEVPQLGPEHFVRVVGAVERPFSLRPADLRELEAHEVIVTIECAGNDRVGMTPLPEGVPWDRGAVSTVQFRGVPLARVLERAGLRPGVVEIRAEGADTGRPDGTTRQVAFSRSLPIAKALDPDTLIAYEMNAAPLTPEHGAPLRLVVPGWYGMASVKWLARLEARATPFEGYFQNERYVYDYANDLPTEPVSEILPKALILEPGARVRHGPVRIAGWAWGGAEIARVEISIDGGEWQEAALGLGLGRYAWRRFELAWDARTPGRHTLRARAIDVRGRQQPEWARYNKHGYGNNAVRPILVDVI